MVYNVCNVYILEQWTVIVIEAYNSQPSSGFSAIYTKWHLLDDFNIVLW